MKLFLSLCCLPLFLNTLHAQPELYQEIMDQDWANLRKFELSNEEILRSGHLPEVVFMGNSITEVWANNYPSFFEEHNFLGRGISGQTTPQMLIRFTQDVTDLQPRAVVILAGTNDIAGNTGFASEKMILDNIIAMTLLAKARGIKVILCSILPVYDYAWRPGLDPSPKIVSINTKLEQYAKDNGHTFVNYHQAMTDDLGGMKKAYSEDGVHPNTKGYQVMEPLVLKGIKEALEQ